MPNWEEFDTWEPTQDYPSAPPARSSSLGEPPSRHLPPALGAASHPERDSGSSLADTHAASFFEEFSAAAEAAGAASANQIPQLPYGDNPGIAALLANAQNMLNADGSQHQDPPFTPSAAADTPEFHAAEVPDAMRADFDTPLAPGEPASPPTPTTPPARTTSPTGRKPTQRRPEPVHSEGWKSLVSGWDEMGGTSAATASPRTGAPGTGARPLSKTHQTSPRAAAHPDTDWERLKAVSPRTPQKTLGTPPSRADLSEPRWKSLTAQTPEGPSKLRLRRVGTGSSEPRPSDGISPLVVLAGGIILSLVSVGIGVSAGMNLVPRPTVTVTATPRDFAKPNSNNPDSIGNADPSEDPAAGTAGGLSGLKVALDPGHNGGNAAAWQQIGTNVPDGRGGQKPCNTTGTATADGYTEHEFNWKIANALKTKLEAAGATVFLTRDSDQGVGPCVDARGQFAQKVGADVMVSIHANGTTDTAQHGFFVMISEPPLNEAQKQPASDLATKLVKSLQEGGFTPQSGGSISSGIWKRSDVATLNFSEVPAAMVELGEMRNPADAALMKSDTGQERYAQSLFDGLKAWAEAARPASKPAPAASGTTAATSPQSPAAGSPSPAAPTGGQ
ncbi:N-acetylmuramoyl-L-alanine amidase [Mobiluncus curtisii]|uniref:N-acetylmuramoyl-L-alanine amidase n=1 Tax=Mobiluncus curtisii TaxID=2051 RepID=A0A7Y0UHB7_9ACTO|nr:N-acetylmuramoyl-L-alanine amidase [Mobiluncus curtisii]MCU9986566.1 N-acetylmuramoyl-L-alanine amidase [Mobiluncus curtisii]MCV0000281.1 N-acetylmuramoyl-L-alanine amidase [Mobiluncus curtisii]NMW48852.1 N-acetylmuramoyl-L-alanine amidase [Mobiluncus curtisii]NMW87303.1 N-acetylmuramoyl-L-alanine amidase [Mobiluncus curtisii]NMX12874.1 N-acetylmuramoyl-L-alanine amidase [Mobiluncus curtisii]